MKFWRRTSEYYEIFFTYIGSSPKFIIYSVRTHPPLRPLDLTRQPIIGRARPKFLEQTLGVVCLRSHCGLDDKNGCSLKRSEQGNPKGLTISPKIPNGPYHPLRLTLPIRFGQGCSVDPEARRRESHCCEHLRSIDPDSG